MFIKTKMFLPKLYFFYWKPFFFIKIDFITNLDCIYLELIFWD